MLRLPAHPVFLADAEPFEVGVDALRIRVCSGDLAFLTCSRKRPTAASAMSR